MVRKVIITGATGFIGGMLAKKLLLQGTTVYGVGRQREKLDALVKYGDFVPVKAEFEQYAHLHELITDRGFDMFWHLAWQGTSTQYYNAHDAQVRNIEAACAAAKSASMLECERISAAGSYYQGCRSNTGSAKGFLNPVIYGTVKKCVLDLFKCIAHQNKIPCINVILSNALGIGDKTNTAVMSFIKRMLVNKPLNLVSGDYPDDWIDVEDLTDGILCAAKSGRPYTDYYIGHRDITTFKEKLLSMKALLLSESELLFGTYPQTYHIDYSEFDLDALYRDTGFEAKIDFEDSILNVAKWVERCELH